MPGVLKNALDWASRPAFRSPLVGKPALIATASPAFTGGVRAQAQLRETLAATLSRVVPAPEIVIGSVHEKVRDGRLVDEAALRFALDGLGVLVAEIRARQVAGLADAA
jgi:chromate reductase